MFSATRTKTSSQEKYNKNQKTRAIPSSNFWNRNFNDFKSKNKTAGACKKMFSIYDYHPKEHRRSHYRKTASSVFFPLEKRVQALTHVISMSKQRDITFLVNICNPW